MVEETRQILAGAAVLAVVGLLVSTIYADAGMTAGGPPGTYTITATFNRVDGVGVGDHVRLAGLRVGTVEALSLDANYRAVLTIAIDSSIKLPTDTSASVQTDGLFGPKFVVLDPGGEETYLKAGDNISFTQDAVIVSDLLDLIIAQGRANRKKQAAEHSK